MNPGPAPSSVHLCLVSNQPIPSLTPLIDPALGVKRALLAASPERTASAEGLCRALAIYQVPAEIVPLEDGYDLAKVRAEFAQLRDRFPDGLSVNITGGTKLMAIAAWLTFDRPQDHLYYVQLKSDCIDWLRPAGLPSHPVDDRLRIEPYLIALGAHCRNDRAPQRTSLRRERRQLAMDILQNHRLVPRIRDLMERIGADPKIAAHRPEGGLVSRLVEAELLGDNINQSMGIVTAFIQGGWLEELVFALIEQMRSTDRLIHDLVRCLRIHRGSEIDPIENEIDVACLRDNTLFLIECKSGTWDVNGDAGQESLRKLAFLRDQFEGAV